MTSTNYQLDAVLFYCMLYFPVKNVIDLYKIKHVLERTCSDSMHDFCYMYIVFNV